RDRDRRRERPDHRDQGRRGGDTERRRRRFGFDRNSGAGARASRADHADLSGRSGDDPPRGTPAPAAIEGERACVSCWRMTTASFGAACVLYWRTSRTLKWPPKPPTAAKL